MFVIFFSGDRSRTKVEKICESFGATKYRLPESTAQQVRPPARLPAAPDGCEVLQGHVTLQVLQGHAKRCEGSQTFRRCAPRARPP